MNDKETKKEIKNSVLFENEEYNKAVDSLKEIISQKDETIGVLTKQIGEKDQVISSYIVENDKEKSARIAAENKVLSQDSSEKSSLEKYSPRKTEEEKFADLYKEACKRVRR